MSLLFSATTGTGTSHSARQLSDYGMGLPATEQLPFSGVMGGRAVRVVPAVQVGAMEGAVGHAASLLVIDSDSFFGLDLWAPWVTPAIRAEHARQQEAKQLHKEQEQLAEIEHARYQREHALREQIIKEQGDRQKLYDRMVTEAG